MKLTILHISDLHRDPSNPISNSALLDSLERDRSRYRNETPPVDEPDLIILSGDVIYGITEDSKEPERELAQQYEQAEEFLDKLAKSFVKGNHERVIIVPGNHDVSFYHTMLSMRKLSWDESHPSAKHVLAEWLQKMSTSNSLLRWSWRDLCFLEIRDLNIYLKRLEAFSSFYERFYGGARNYSLEPDQQFHIFDYPELELSIAAFSSCWNNDPLNRQGIIHPDCIAEAARELRKPKYSDRIRVAVWHHNTNGPPLRTDYLDSAVLQVLIDSNFSLGFHGHQHKAQFIDEKFQFGTNRKITVVSAGTLCAGPKALPAGHARAYNLVELNTDSFKARLHTRSMQNDAFEQPIWAPGHLASSMTSFVDFDLQRPHSNRGGGIADIGAAETLVRTKRFAEAIPLLKPLMATQPIARRLLLECYTSLDRTKDLIEHFYPPTADNEIIYLADALWTEGRQDLLRELLGSNIVRTSLSPAVLKLVTNFKERMKP